MKTFILAAALAITALVGVAYAQNCSNGMKCYTGQGGHTYCQCN